MAARSKKPEPVHRAAGTFMHKTEELFAQRVE